MAAVEELPHSPSVQQDRPNIFDRHFARLIGVGVLPELYPGSKLSARLGWMARYTSKLNTLAPIFPNESEKVTKYLNSTNAIPFRQILSEALHQQIKGKTLSGTRTTCLLIGLLGLSPTLPRDNCSYPSTPADGQIELSPDELAWMRLVAKGYSRDNITTKLGISVHNHRNLIEMMKIKFGASDRLSWLIKAADLEKIDLEKILGQPNIKVWGKVDTDLLRVIQTLHDQPTWTFNKAIEWHGLGDERTRRKLRDLYSQLTLPPERCSKIQLDVAVLQFHQYLRLVEKGMTPVEATVLPAEKRRRPEFFVIRNGKSVRLIPQLLQQPKR